jgi:hypothetical protein
MSAVAVAVVVSMFRCCTVSDDGLCLVACCDQRDNTALLLACKHGHLDLARWLVTDAGSDARSERNGVSSCYRSECDRCDPIVICAATFSAWCVVL